MTFCFAPLDAELADKTANARSVMELLAQAGYRLHDVEHGKFVSAMALGLHPPSYLYCTRERSSSRDRDAV